MTDVPVAQAGNGPSRPGRQPKCRSLLARGMKSAGEGSDPTASRRPHLTRARFCSATARVGPELRGADAPEQQTVPSGVDRQPPLASHASQRPSRPGQPTLPSPDDGNSGGRGSGGARAPNCAESRRAPSSQRDARLGRDSTARVEPAQTAVSLWRRRREWGIGRGCSSSSGASALAEPDTYASRSPASRKSPSLRSMRAECVEDAARFPPSTFVA